MEVIQLKEYRWVGTPLLHCLNDLPGHRQTFRRPKPNTNAPELGESLNSLFLFQACCRLFLKMKQFNR